MVFFFLVLSASICAAIDPVQISSPNPPLPPALLPPTWHSSVLVNVVDDHAGSIYTKEQLIYFDLNKNAVCRYNQEMLNPKSTTAETDICDWTVGMHYGIQWTTGTSNVRCSTKAPTNYTLQQLQWPSAFLSAARWIGQDKVNSYICDHWSAVGISLDGKTQNLDVWTNIGNYYLCQISLRDQGGHATITWAFDGFSDQIPPEVEACTAPALICDKPDWLCHAKSNIDPDSLGQQLAAACDPKFLDCSPINPYGDHFEPNTVEAHCNWAFNQYYQLYRLSSGTLACYFQGVAELVPPSNASLPLSKPYHSQSSSSSVLSFLANLDLVC